MFTFEMSKQSNGTTIMNTPTINLSEESKGLITLHLSNGHSVNMTTDQLESFVERHNMNLESCGNGLTCDPWSCEYDVETPVSDWLDVEANFYLACAEYYRLVILGGE